MLRSTRDSSDFRSSIADDTTVQRIWNQCLASVEKLLCIIIFQGKWQLMYGPTIRVAHSGSLFHILTLFAYFGLSGLTGENLLPGRRQY